MNETSRLPSEARLRAADTDRDRAIEVLAGAAAEGRLTQEEYSERSETALSARCRHAVRRSFPGLTTCMYQVSRLDLCLSVGTTYEDSGSLSPIQGGTG